MGDGIGHALAGHVAQAQGVVHEGVAGVELLGFQQFAQGGREIALAHVGLADFPFGDRQLFIVLGALAAAGP